MREDALVRLRADLVEAGYEESAQRSWLSPDVANALLRGVSGPARAALEVRAAAAQLSDASHTLAQLFMLGDGVKRASAAHAFPSLSVNDAIEIGLLAERDDLLYAAMSVTLYGDWYVLSDLDDHLRRGEASPDHVMGVGGATRSLIDALPPVAGMTALEIGTGCGIVALVLASQARKVIATDVSLRAAMFARANAALNGFSNIEVRVGDLCEPVAGELFDLIASNPPFVIAPQSDEHFVYRTSNEPGDRLLRRMLAEAPSHLAPGGTLVCLANWEFVWGGLDGEDTLHDLVPTAGATCSAWLIERGRQTPLEYASLWLRDGGLHEQDPRYQDELMGWITDLSERNVSRVCFGYLMLRRDDLGTLVFREAFDGALGGSGAFGDDWAETFSIAQRVGSLSSEQVLEHRFSLRDNVEEVRTLVPGTEDITSISFVRRGGIERFEAVDTLTSAVLGACDGELTIGEIAAALASLLEIDHDTACEQAAAVAYSYSVKGYLDVAEPALS